MSVGKKWQNLLIAKCLGGKMYVWQNILVGKCCLIRKIFFYEEGKRLGGIMSRWKNVLLKKESKCRGVTMSGVVIFFGVKKSEW